MNWNPLTKRFKPDRNPSVPGIRPRPLPSKSPARSQAYQSPVAGLPEPGRRLTRARSQAYQSPVAGLPEPGRLPPPITGG